MIIPNLDRPTNFLSILHLSLIVLILPLASRAETPPLVVSEPILVPATKGRFDCLRVDEQFHRLLANHTGNGTLDVFDLPDGKLRQTVPIGAAQDVAIDNERGKYCVTVSDRSVWKISSCAAMMKLSWMVWERNGFLIRQPVEILRDALIKTHC